MLACHNRGIRNMLNNLMFRIFFSKFNSVRFISATANWIITRYFVTHTVFQINNVFN